MHAYPTSIMSKKTDKFDDVGLFISVKRRELKPSVVSILMNINEACLWINKGQMTIRRLIWLM